MLLTSGSYDMERDEYPEKQITDDICDPIGVDQQNACD
jgi:hypothetical protein